MSEPLLSEQLDRIRRMMEAGLIRLEKTESNECLVQLRLAIVAITTLIDEVREEEKQKHAETINHSRRVRRHENGKADQSMSGRDSGHGPSSSATAESRDIHAGKGVGGGHRESPDARHDRAVRDCQDSGSICGYVSAGPD